MILVDSSLWIEVLQKPDSPMAQRLDELLESGEACTCGVILQEVLQGARDPRAREQLRAQMYSLPFLEANRDSYLAAAYLFGRCRRQGIAVHTVDALIMALTIQHRVALFTLDEDFIKVASLDEDLKIYR